MRALLAWTAIGGAMACGAASATAADAWCSAPAAPSAVVKSLTASATKLTTGSPRAIPRLHTEGTLPHQGIWDASTEARKDLHLMRDLAMAWRATQDPAQLAQLASLLDAWAGVYQPSFNPIDETDFDMLIDAWAITQSKLPPATREKTAAMLRGWATGYLREIHDPAHRGQMIWKNNWQSHRIKLVTLMAVALDDDGLLAAAREEFKKQLGQNLYPDGRTIDFDERDALHYTVYDLEPLTRAAMAARLRGEDWLHLKGDNGASLAAALDWLLPYASDEKVHDEYVHTKVKFDLQRRDAGVHGFTGQWDPQSSKQLYWLAATLDAKYRPVAQRLDPKAPTWVQSCWAP